MEAVLAKPHHECNIPQRRRGSLYETGETVLAGRCYLYRLGQRLFGSEPTEELLEAAFSSFARDAFGMFVDLDADETADAICVLDIARTTFESDRPAFVEEAREAYTRLFLGPSTLPSPPWESVHVPGDRTLFNATTLKVRRFYAEKGFRSQEYPHVADDHLAIELDFLTALSQKSLEALRASNIETARTLLDDQRDFLIAHPARWTDAFAKKLVEHLSTSESPAPVAFYGALASATAAFIACDLEVVDGMLASLSEANNHNLTGIDKQGERQ